MMVQTERRQLNLWFGLIAWGALLAVISYGAALRLPFFTDDPIQLPYAAARDLSEIWHSAEGLTYYRPLAFTVWKIMYGLWGRHDATALHALNLLLHVVNSLMVGWLADRPTQPGHYPDWRRRYVGAALFLLYPFSFDAVPWIAAVMHPLAVALVLAGVISFLKMSATKSRRWAALSLSCVFLAPFAHENGVLAGPLVVAFALTQLRGKASFWSELRQAAWWLVPGFIWWLIWRQVPVDRGANWLALNNAAALLRNGVYFAQGAAYPVTWLGVG